MLAFLLLPLAAQAQVQLSRPNEDRISVSINGLPFSDFYIGPATPKPYLAPLRSAGGIIVTRRFPMETVQGESRDHPHHRGLWVGYGDINGINFWENDPASKVSGANPAGKGDIRLKTLDAMQPGKKSGSISATFEWLAPDGHPVLNEHRIMTFYADPDVRKLDVDFTLTAVQQAVFADTKEGFFAIRVADAMAGKKGGVLTNSEGAQTEKDVWGKRADWVDYDGTVEGQRLGILILDHPENPNHPPRWHARDYGLFAVNPFGIKDFDPKSTEKGGLTLREGKSLRFRYRVIIHSGDVSKKTMARWYSDFAKDAK